MLAPKEKAYDDGGDYLLGVLSIEAEVVMVDERSGRSILLGLRDEGAGAVRLFEVTVTRGASLW